MESSDSLLEHLAGAPTDDDWRRLDLYQPLLRAWLAQAKGDLAPTPFPLCWLGDRRH